jgi:hypothetical protein
MITRYLSGLLSCALGLCGGGWLIITVVLLGGVPTDASLVSLGTGAGVALLSAAGTGCWAVAWRQRMRLDGAILGGIRPLSRGQARRNRRILRRDMRRAARLARRTARRRDERVPCTPGPPLPPFIPPVTPPFIPPPRVPAPDEAAGAAGRGPESPVVLLSELRAILEPLLATGPLPTTSVPPAAWFPAAVPRTVVSPAAMEGEETW